MKLDNLKDLLKNKKGIVPTVLLLFSVLCCILILWKVTSFFMASANAESVVKRAIEQSEIDPNDRIEKQLASSAAITDELKKNNLFAPPPAKQHPVKEVSGIFGDQVFIKDKWYNVGDTIDNAKIVAIGPTSVTIAWDGKEKTFLPIQAQVAEAQSGQRGRTASANRNEGDSKGKSGEKRPTNVTVQVEGGRPGFGGRGGPGEAFMAMRQRFENMSEREREEFRNNMRERFGGGRGGPGGGRDFGGRGGPGGRPGGRR